MKTFCIVYQHIVSTDAVVRAKNKKQAKEKFREVMPDETITDVWEVNEQLVDY